MLWIFAVTRSQPSWDDLIWDDQHSLSQSELSTFLWFGTDCVLPPSALPCGYVESAEAVLLGLKVAQDLSLSSTCIFILIIFFL